jgi:outer membrane protein assembly factor BamB
MAARALWAAAQQLSLAGAVAIAFDREVGAGHGGGHGRSAARVGVTNKFGVTRYSTTQIGKISSSGGAYWPDSASRGNALYAGAEDLTDNVSWGWHHPSGVYGTIPVGAPLIDSELNVYVGSDDAIRKFDALGELVWSYAPRGQLAAAPSIAINSPSRRFAVAPTEVSAEEEAALKPNWAKQGDDSEIPYGTLFAQVRVGDRLKVRPGKSFLGDGKELYKAGDQGRIVKVIGEGGGGERVVIKWPRTGHESVASLASLGKRFVRVASEISTASLPPMIVGSTTSGYVFAIGLSDGEEIWATQASEQIAGVKGAVGAKDGVVVVATNRCTNRYCYRYRNQTNPLTPSNSIVRGLSAADGSALWTYRTRSPVWNMVPQWGPDDTVMFQDFEANGYCLNFKTGALVWKFRAPRSMGTYTNAAAVYDNTTQRLFTMGAKEYEHKYCNPYPAPGVLPHCGTWPGSQGMIYGVNASSGRKLWETETHEPPASAAVGFLNSPPGHTRLVVTLGYNCRYNSPSEILSVDPHSGHVRWEKEGPTLWASMCAGDKEGGDIRRAMGGRAACVPNSWSSPVIDSNGDVYVGNQVGVLQKWGSPSGRTADVQLLSTLTTGVAFQDSAIAFGPGIMAVSTCTSLIVLQTSEGQGDNFTFSPYEY